MSIRIAIIALFFILPSTHTWSQIVKWTDENGKVHFGDRVPEKYKKKSEQLEMNSANVVKNEHKRSPSWNRKRNTYIPERVAKVPTKESGKKSLQKECKAFEKYYKQITMVTYQGDTRTFSALKKDGSPVTNKDVHRLKKSDLMNRKEQNRHVEKLRKEWNRKGCSIPQTKKLAL